MSKFSLFVFIFFGSCIALFTTILFIRCLEEVKYPIRNDRQQVIEVINCSGKCVLEDEECTERCEKDCLPKSPCDRLLSETKLATMEAVLCFDQCLKSSIEQSECYQLCTKHCQEGTLCWLQFSVWYKQVQ